MRILVIGPGALGIVATVRLQQAGHDVEVAVRSQEKAQRLSMRGLTLIDVDGQEHLERIQCVWDPATSGPYELIIHTTKCHVAEDVMRTWLPTLAKRGWVVPFQNGVEGDGMQAVVGDRFMECSVYWPATLHSEGVSIHTGHGNNVIGPWPRGEASEDHRRIAAVLSAIAPTQVSAQMLGVKWSKLAINAAMTSCGVVTGKTLGEMIAHGPSRKAFLGVVRETMAVMRAAGIKPVRVGASKPDLLAKLPDWAARLVLRAAAKRYGTSISSSAQSMARGETTEVDYLNGRVVSVGAKYGIPTPVNQAVVETVHAIERGEVQQGFEAIDRMMHTAKHL